MKYTRKLKIEIDKVQNRRAETKQEIWPVIGREYSQQEYT